MKILKTFLCVILFNITLLAQSGAGSAATYESPCLIDMPTAGVLEKGFAGVDCYLMPGGATLARIQVGVFKDFNFGISYGAANFIGVGAPKWYKMPGINVKLKILDETERSPVITAGFDSQGKGKYNDSTSRFEVKSPGFFAAVTKNFDFLGFLSLHGMANYSLEKDDGDRDLDLWFGVEKTIGEKFSILFEYDFAINDNARKSNGDGTGYMNIGFRFSLGDGLTLGLDLRDILDNKKIYAGGADRALKVEFVKSMF